MLKAKDIMTESVITVKPTTTIQELAQILIRHKISGVPVTNDAGEIMGIVTENDLISQNKRLHIPTVMRLFDAFVVLERQQTIENEIKKMTAATVAEIYTKKVTTVTPDTSLEVIATIMSEKRVHLIPVVEGSKIKGIIGKMDMLKGIING